MEDAVFITPCQHGCCKTCLTNAVEVCPVCREDISGQNRSKIVDDRRIREIVGNLIFACDVPDCKDSYPLRERKNERIIEITILSLLKNSR